MWRDAYGRAVKPFYPTRFGVSELSCLSWSVENTLQRWTAWYLGKKDLYSSLFTFVVFTILYLSVLFFLWHLFLWPFLLLNQASWLSVETFSIVFFDSLMNSFKKNHNNPLRLIFIMGTHRVKVFYRIILSSTTIHLCWCLLKTWSCLFVLFIFIAKVNFAIIRIFV